MVYIGMMNFMQKNQFWSVWTSGMDHKRLVLGGVEERRFKDDTWSLVVCHRIIGKEWKEGNEKGQGEDRKEYIA